MQRRIKHTFSVVMSQKSDVVSIHYTYNFMIHVILIDGVM